MDKRSSSGSLHQKRPKQARAKQQQQPIKVVYISTPVKVKASAAEFRAKVQELTGQDSDVADLQLSNFPAAAAAADGEPPADAASAFAACTDSTSEEMVNEPFTPQMLEGFPAFSPSAPSLYYQPPQGQEEGGGGGSGFRGFGAA